MIFTKTPINGLFVVDLEKKEDSRGYFARAWCQKEFEEYGIKTDFVQFNQSYSERRGTTRGLHYQEHPFSEVKLVRCTKGSIFDVAVDLRSESATFGKWYSIELSEKNGKALYIPEGFAHGYQTLEDDTYIFYQVSQFYAPTYERGILWNDSSIAIDWPIVENVIVSDKDLSLNTFDSLRK